MARRRSPFIYIRYAIETAAAIIIMLIFRALPLDTASNLGARIARKIGPHTRADRTARINLRLAFPSWTAPEYERIIEGMWDNLGRVVAEYPHLATKTISRRIEIIGADHISEAKDRGRPLMFISGHIGNWELAAKTAWLLGTPLMLIYRPANNPLFDKLIHIWRRKFYAGMFAKGQSAAIRLVKSIKKGAATGLLIDQKMNDGIVVPFFGHPAMTAPAMGELALKYDITVIPARIVRTKGANFKAVIYPPMVFNRRSDPYSVMVDVHALLERWIHETPEQWFWVHQRFAKEYYA